MSFAVNVRKISEELSYNLLSAPDYDEEDQTSLDREEQLLHKWLGETMAMVKREDVGDWLRLCDQMVIQSFDHFRKNDNRAARRAIQTAQEYLGNAVSKKPFKVDFIGRLDGTLESAPEDED